MYKFKYSGTDKNAQTKFQKQQESIKQGCQLIRNPLSETALFLLLEQMVEIQKSVGEAFRAKPDYLLIAASQAAVKWKATGTGSGVGNINENQFYSSTLYMTRK